MTQAKEFALDQADAAFAEASRNLTEKAKRDELTLICDPRDIERPDDPEVSASDAA
ncbi:MAG: hypothetical protein AAF328_05450 [Planctomycetota bacterium]